MNPKSFKNVQSRITKNNKRSNRGSRKRNQQFYEDYNTKERPEIILDKYEMDDNEDD